MDVHSNNWLLLAEQAAVHANATYLVSVQPRPMLSAVPTVMEENETFCLLTLMMTDNPVGACAKYDQYLLVAAQNATPPLFSSNVQGNYTCIIRKSESSAPRPMGEAPKRLCQNIVNMTTWHNASHHYSKG